MEKFTESMFQNKRIKLVFFLAVLFFMRFYAEISWWDAFILALILAYAGGIIIFMVGDFIEKDMKQPGKD